MHFGGKIGCIEKMFVKLEMTRASPGSSLVDKYVGNPTCGDVFGVVGPSLVANAKWFYAFDLALGVPAAVDLRACVLAGLLGRSAYQGRGAGARKASGQVGTDG